MKNIIYLLIIIHFLSSIAYAQWIKQYHNTVGVGLYDVEFMNNTTGWACGEGIILKTTNAGNEWIPQIPATGEALFSISAIDSNIVYCAGFFMTILKTTNGGTDWIAIQNGGQNPSYEGIFFINKDTGWVCGSSGTILKTTNGGLNFVNNPIFWGYLKDMCFINADTGLLCGEFGGMFKTTNGGLNWDRKTIPYYNGIGDFRKLSVIDDKYVFVTEDGRRVFRSTNFGDSWDSIGYVAGADQPYVCSFSSLNTGWVGGTLGQLYKSTNAGGTWRRENTNSDPRFIYSMHFLSDSVGWLVGGNTKIFFTTTGGLTFVTNNATTEIVKGYNLFQNYPNPFNPITKIRFEIPISTNAKITVFNSAGMQVEILFDKWVVKGNYEVNFDARNYPSGIYFYKLQTENFESIKKMIIVK